MWHPRQLLKEPIVGALLLGGFDPLQIEFLGWRHGMAFALNNSRNPVKAAHTMLARIGVEDGMTKLMDSFKKRKLESIKPSDADPHEKADNAFRDLKDVIQSHLEEAQITAQNYVDYTQGGVSDGSDLNEAQKAAIAQRAAAAEEDADE